MRTLKNGLEMITSQERVNYILEKHKRWLDKQEGGECADFKGMTVTVPGFRHADLRFADLSHAVFTDADFYCADLRNANLSGGRFQCLSFCGANLAEADLSRAYFVGSNFTDASLHSAKMQGANMQQANMSTADFTGANLRDTDFRGANIAGAKFLHAEDGNMCRIDVDGQSVCVRSSFTAIGCCERPNSSWLEWGSDSPEIQNIGIADWWRVHGDLVKSAIRIVLSQTV